MELLSQIFGAKRRERMDARSVYHKLMAQSRQPEFYGEDRVPDSYEGRIEMLTLHMAFTMKAMQQNGEQGRKLSQALFDEMVDDFDVSLREEGLTDSGVKRRIKPIVKLFYLRLKAFTESENTSDLEAALGEGEFKDCRGDFTRAVAAYGMKFESEIATCSLGGLATANFDFPVLEL